MHTRVHTRSNGGSVKRGGESLERDPGCTTVGIRAYRSNFRGSSSGSAETQPRHAYHGRIKDTLSLRHASLRGAPLKAACFRCDTSFAEHNMDSPSAILLEITLLALSNQVHQNSDVNYCKKRRKSTRVFNLKSCVIK